MSSQQLDLFDDYASDLQQEQTDSLQGFYEAIGLRRHPTVVYGDDNPFVERELYVPVVPEKNMGALYQLIGNLGAYANRDFRSDTDVIMLPDITLKRLEQGVRDDVMHEIERLYKKSPIKFLKIRYTCVSDYIAWVKRRLEKAPDPGSISLLDLYEKS